MTNKIRVGNTVRFINAEMHYGAPSFYPPVGTIGTVKKVQSDIQVQWQKGTTSEVDLWWCEKDWVEVVE